MLTDKCKEAFEEWYGWSEHPYIFGYDDFLMLNFQMQYGVYLEFFDNIGIYIQSNYNEHWGFAYDVNDELLPNYNTRQEAQIEAIKKANEIFNGRA